MRRITLILFAALTFAAQELPDAAGLLQKTAESLQNHRSYQYTFEIDTRITRAGSTDKTIATQSFWFAAPRKYRVETKMDGVDGLTLVSDGRTTWFYEPASKQYSSMPTAADVVAVPSEGRPITAKRQVMQNVRTVRAEKLEIGGISSDCWLIESRIARQTEDGPGEKELDDAVYTVWIDQKTGIDLKTVIRGRLQDQSGPADFQMIKTRRALKLDGDIPDTVFVFTPPEGAKEIGKS